MNISTKTMEKDSNKAVWTTDGIKPAPSLLRRAIRPVVSLVLLAFLLSHAGIDQVWSRILTANPAGIALAVAFIVLALVVSAIKWGILLKAKGAPAPLPFLFSSYLVGLFFNNFLPSNIGGDIVRITEVAKRTGKPAEATASVIGERLIAGLALALTAVAGLFLSFQVSGQFAGLVGGLTLFFVAVLASIASRRARATIGATLRRLLPAHWVDKAGQVAGSMAVVLRDPSTFLWVMIWSLAFHLSVVLVNYAIFLALGLEVSFITLLLYIPIISAIQLAPVSVNGLGVREGAYVYFFGTVGIAAAPAVTASLLFWALVMLVSLPGGLIFASRR